MRWLCCGKGSPPDVCFIVYDTPVATKTDMHYKGKDVLPTMSNGTPPSSNEGSPISSSVASRQETTITPSIFYDRLEPLPAESLCREEEWFPAVELWTPSNYDPCTTTGVTPLAVTVTTSKDSSERALREEQSFECSQSLKCCGRSSSQHLVGGEIKVTPQPIYGDSSSTSFAASSGASGSAVPLELHLIVTSYLQGTQDSCHTLAKLWAYKKSHALTKEQLKEQMAPLLAAGKAEQSIAAGVQLGSTLCAASAASASAAVAETGEGPGEAVAGSAEAVKGTVSQLLSNLERLQHFHDSCLREEGFKQVSFGALQLYHDHDKEMKKHHIKAHCIIKETVVNLICLTREVDLFTTWTPAISQAEQLQQLALNELLVHLVLWAPWPIPAPELLLHAVGADLLEQEQVVLLACNEMMELPDDCRQPVTSGRRCRLHVDVGGFCFKPLLPNPVTGEPRTDVTVLFTLDGSNIAIPDAFISFGLKVFFPLVYQTVLRCLKKMFHSQSDSKLAERLQERQSLYRPLAKHVERFLADELSKAEYKKGARV